MNESIIAGFIANYIFLFSGIILAWLLYQFTRRAKLLKFFGIDKSKRIVIYLSNLKISYGGATGIDNVPYSFQGLAVPFGEMQQAIRFYKLFNFFLPSLADKPGILNKLLISDIQIDLIPSPRNQDEIEMSSSFVTIGGPAYNLASRLAETLSTPRFTPNSSIYWSNPEATSTTTTTTSDPSGTITHTSPMQSASTTTTLLPANYPEGKTDVDEPNPLAQNKELEPAIEIENVPRIEDTTFGIVERIYDHNQNRYIFYVAGLSELGTVGAAYYLATEWFSLSKEHKSNTNFLRLLRFDPTDYRRWTIVFFK